MESIENTDTPTNVSMTSNHQIRPKTMLQGMAPPRYVRLVGLVGFRSISRTAVLPLFGIWGKVGVGSARPGLVLFFLFLSVRGMKEAEKEDTIEWRVQAKRYIYMSLCLGIHM